MRCKKTPEEVKRLAALDILAQSYRHFEVLEYNKTAPADIFETWGMEQVLKKLRTAGISETEGKERILKYYNHSLGNDAAH